MYYRKDSLTYLILLKIRLFCKLIKLQTYLCTCMKFEIHPFIAWDMATEEKRGLGTRLAMRCKICRCVSKRYKLYKEVSTQSPGRKAATVNYGIQVGLSQTSNNWIRKTLASANTPPPSQKSLQKTSNINVSKIYVL